MNSLKISGNDWQKILEQNFVFQIEWIPKAEDEHKVLMQKWDEFTSELGNETEYTYVS